MSIITFKTQLFKIGSWTILRFPDDASAKLPSRGQVMVEGTINGVHVKTPLEPDGKWSHWLHLDSKLLKEIDAGAGDPVEVSVDAIKNWPEPEVPEDFKQALTKAPQAIQELFWKQITPMARWEWIRWMRATGSTETRQRRIEVGISKLSSGERRPCCWNRNMCTEPSVSKSGVLLVPEQVAS